MDASESVPDETRQFWEDRYHEKPQIWSGKVNRNLQTEVASRLRHNAGDIYAQDNYKITPQVTIDAGIRWEPFLPPVDNLNDQMCFDPTLTKLAADGQL